MQWLQRAFLSAGALTDAVADADADAVAVAEAVAGVVVHEQQCRVSPGPSRHSDRLAISKKTIDTGSQQEAGAKTRAYEVTLGRCREGWDWTWSGKMEREKKRT